MPYAISIQLPQTSSKKKKKDNKKVRKQRQYLKLYNWQKKQKNEAVPSNKKYELAPQLGFSAVYKNLYQ